LIWSGCGGRGRRAPSSAVFLELDKASILDVKLSMAFEGGRRERLV
jgi:hypothetical protein